MNERVGSTKFLVTLSLITQDLQKLGFNEYDWHRPMKWIQPGDLGPWGQKVSARTQFPGLVADLLRASLPIGAAFRFRFPHGEDGNVRGYDGDLEVGELRVDGPVGGRIPAGRSFWEFGTGSDRKKPFDDAEKRTKKETEDVQRETTLVLAVTWSADNPKEAVPAAEKRLKDAGHWKEVVFLDGAAIEGWLTENPGVAARYAKTILKTVPEVGAVGLDEFWRAYSREFDPEINYAIALSGRREQAEEFVNALADNEEMEFSIISDSPDEATAFGAAALLSRTDEVGRQLALRTLVVETAEAARQLSDPNNLICFATRSATPSFGLLSAKGQAVLAKGRTAQAKRSDMILPSPRPLELNAVLQELGLNEAKAELEARRCGGSLTIMRRTMARTGASRPSWIDTSRDLVPLFLAGAWKQTNEHDQSALASLSGDAEYGTLEDRLRPFRNLDDPVLAIERRVWSARSQIDGLVQVADHVGHDARRRLQTVLGDVFSDDAIAGNEDPDKPYVPADLRHSDLLRNGLATSLLVLACLPELGVPDLDPDEMQDFVRATVARLPALQQHEGFMSGLGSQLPYIAEAAPVPFLEALETQIKGNEDALKVHLRDRTHYFTPVGLHTNLLFGLETLAWLPEHFTRVVKILFTLAGHDPGGRLGNRPLNTLREIFLVWAPSTYASWKERLAVLEHYVEHQPTEAWQLLERLLPRSQDIGSPTSHPRFRAAGLKPEILTVGLVNEGYGKVTSLAISLAGDDPDRIEALLSTVGSIGTEGLDQLLAHIDDVLNANREQDRIVWEKAKAEAQKHRAFSDVDWTLKGDDLTRLEALVARHAPTDEVARSVWLFNDWLPIIPETEMDDEVKGRRDAVDDARAEAVVAVEAEQGLGGLIKLALLAKLPQLVGNSVADLIVSRGVDAMFDVLDAVGAEKADGPLALSVVRRSSFDFPNEFLDRYVDWGKAMELNTPTIVAALNAMKDVPAVWDCAEAFGADVVEKYWTTKSAWALEDCAVAEVAADRFSNFGRPIAALEALAKCYEQVDGERLVTLLSAGIEEINRGGPSGMLSDHRINKALESLIGRGDVDVRTVAALEFRYFPLIEDRDRRAKRVLAVHALMRDDPAYFVHILSLVFRGENEDASDMPEGEEGTAKIAYRVLSSFSQVPGTDDSRIDETVLRQWIEGVRSTAEEADRKKIAEIHIGNVLAHAPDDPDDSAWPHKGIREVVEWANSEELDRGMTIERLNMRGVFSRGIYEGGNQERDIATRYEGYAERCAGYPRTIMVLQRIAASYKADAVRADEQAAADGVRFAQ